jgi:hypothetical protein
MMGQSNMLGEGKITGYEDGTLEYAVKEKKLYPYLLDKSGDWAVRGDARNVFVMGSGGADSSTTVFHNEWFGVNDTHKKTIGPEIGIGNFVTNYTGSPTMFLKSCIGNRALGWDLLPPGSPEWEYTGSDKVTYTYAGYHESPMKWPKGNKPAPGGWIAGEQYDADTARAKWVLQPQHILPRGHEI